MLNVRDNTVGVPPEQTVLDCGWERMVGDAFTITAAVALVTLQPGVACETMQ